MCARLFVVVSVIAVLGAYCPGAIIYDLSDPTVSYTLTEVNAADGLKVGDKLFSNFLADTTKTQGAVAPGLGEIAIRGIEVNGDFGLIFSGLWQAASGQVADTAITFKVTAGDGYLIKDNGLKLLGYGATNGGSVSVAEVVYSGEPSSSPAIAHKFVNYTNDGTNWYGNLEDHQEFTPMQEIWVVKDVGASGGTDPEGFSQISQFQQTFSQIPEPATMGLLAIGGLTLLSRRRRA